MILAGYPAVPSLVKPAEAAALELAATGARVLEIGAAWGFSTILMARVAREVWSIDPHDSWDTWEAFTANLVRYGVQDKVTALRFRSEDVLGQLGRDGQRFDLAFIDGDHSYERCAFDIYWCLNLVRAGGIIAIHDYCTRWPGVLAAVKGTLGDRGSGFAPFPAWRIQDLYLAAV